MSSLIIAMSSEPEVMSQKQTNCLGRMVKCLTNLPLQRSDEDIEEMWNWLQKISLVFQPMTKDVALDALRYCRYQHAKNDEVIIRQGDVGDSFYVILSGSVAVYIDSTLSGEDDSSQTDAILNCDVTRHGGVIAKSSGISVQEAHGGKSQNHVCETTESGQKERYDDFKPLGMFDNSDLTENNCKKVKKTPSRKSSDDATDNALRRSSGKKLDRGMYGRFIIKFEAGKCFGEVALLTDDSVRNATIIADDDVDLLVLHRHLYNRSLKASQEADYADRRAFTQRHPFFTQWNARFRRLLEMSLRREQYSYDSPIVQQGQPIVGLLFIRKGGARVIVEPGRHKRQYPELMPFITQNDPLVLERLRSPLKVINDHLREQGSGNNIAQERVRIRRRGGYALAEKRMVSRSVDLCNVEEGECVGDIEMYLNIATYMQTVITTAKTEVYILDLKNFERLISKKNPSTLEKLRFCVVSKLRSRCSSQQGKNIPLMKHLLFMLTAYKKPELLATPKLKMSKHLPDGDVLDRVLIDRFIRNKSALVRPVVPGSFYYMGLMEERTRIRDNIRKKQETVYKRNDDERHLRSTVQVVPSLQLLTHPERTNYRRSDTEILPIRNEDVTQHTQHRVTASGSVITASDLSQVCPPPVKANDQSERGIFFRTEIATDDVIGEDKKHPTEVSNEFLKPVQIDEVSRRSSLTVDRICRRGSQNVDRIQKPVTKMRFLNAVVTHKLGQLAEKLQGDFETSDATLNFLEHRVNAFLAKYNGDQCGRKLPNNRLPPLKRFEIDDNEINVPKPGGCVVVKRKQCRFANCPYLVKDHSHNRYHVVTSLPEVEKLRKKQFVMNYVMRKAAQRNVHNRYGCGLLK